MVTGSKRGNRGATSQASFETASEAGAVRRLVEQGNCGTTTADSDDLAFVIEQRVVITFGQADKELLDGSNLLCLHLAALHKRVLRMIKHKPGAVRLRGLPVGLRGEWLPRPLHQVVAVLRSENALGQRD